MNHAHGDAVFAKGGARAAACSRLRERLSGAGVSDRWGSGMYTFARAWRGAAGWWWGGEDRVVPRTPPEFGRGQIKTQGAAESEIEAQGGAGRCAL